MSSLRSVGLLALASGFAAIANAQSSGTGVTTRYWDCCKPSCGWTGKASVLNPVTSCDINDNPLTGYTQDNGCTGGTAYTCSSQQPWAVSETESYGFAAVNIAGGTEASWCCSCYKLSFTGTNLTMVVQATNTGADLGSNQFDLAMPGGGVGIYNGCTAEWGAPSSGWGAQYGGITTDTCSTFPVALQPGCDWRFSPQFDLNNPAVTFEEVTCPLALVEKSGCQREGTTPTGPSSVATYGGSSATSATASSTTVESSTASATSAAYSAATSAASSAESSAVSSAASSAASSAISSAASSIASSAAASSAVAPASTFSTASSVPVVTSAASSAVAPTTTASSTTSADANCEAKYVYAYDL